MRVPFFTPELTEEDVAAVAAVLRSGWIAAGPKVEAFEQTFAERLGVRHVVAVNSCTAALHLANLLLDVGPGDEVIVPSLTFAATVNAVRFTGATPVFADISGPNDWCLDPRHVESLVTSRTRAVVAMHYAGHPCDMAALAATCARHGLALCEDAAHGLGGSLDGKALGTLGRIGCFSFYSNKGLTTAEGGMLITDDADFAARARRLRSHGQTATAIDREKGATGYDIGEIGFNYRMDDLRAALGLSQLTRFDAMQAARHRLVRRYAERLAEIPQIRVPRHGGRGVAADYLLPVLVATGNRDTLRTKLAAAGVQTSVHYPPVHLLAPYRRDGRALPRTEAVAEQCMTLPLFPTMRDDEVDYVCDALARAFAEVQAA